MWINVEVTVIILVFSHKILIIPKKESNLSSTTATFPQFTVIIQTLQWSDCVSTLWGMITSCCSSNQTKWRLMLSVSMLCYTLAYQCNGKAPLALHRKWLVSWSANGNVAPKFGSEFYLQQNLLISSFHFKWLPSHSGPTFPVYEKRWLPADALIKGNDLKWK